MENPLESEFAKLSVGVEVIGTTTYENIGGNTTIPIVGYSNIVTPVNYQPNHPPLVGKELELAIKEQIYEYPKVIRGTTDPPIPNQAFGNVSYMLFDKPKKLKNTLVYGFFRLRGNHGDPETCRNAATKIVREFDSQNQIKIAPVGSWLPITEDNLVVQDVYDVRTNKDEIHLQDEAKKEKESQAKAIALQLKEAQEKLESDGDLYDDFEALKFYIMKRVTQNEILSGKEAYEKKVEEYTKKLGKTRVILKLIEKHHPEYVDQWVGEYNKERERVGLLPHIPSELELETYNSITLDDLIKEGYPMPSDAELGINPDAYPKEEEKKEHVINFDSDINIISKKSGKY